MAAYTIMMNIMLLLVLHVAPVWGVTMSTRDKAALTAVRGAIENKENFPAIECGTGVFDSFRCDPSGRVTLIDLHNKGLKGRIAPEIGNLTRLEQLGLAVNQLSGSIPSSIGNFRSLLSLTLSGNQLSGSIPSSIGRLKTLQNLGLHKNLLSGSIPSAIGNLTYLQYLNLNKNQLTGSIPWSIGNLESLNYLWLSDNKLSGSIPWSIGQLHVTGMWLFNNQLSGSIPSSIGDLKYIQSLWLGNNQLGGGVPSSIKKMLSLIDFDITNNYFAGPIAQVNDHPLCRELTTNCLFGSRLPPGCESTIQRSVKTCLAFCNATQVGGPCGGHGICSNSTDGKTRVCACDLGYSDKAKKYTCKLTFPPISGRETVLTRTRRSPPPFRLVKTPPSPKPRPSSPHSKPPLKALHSPPHHRPPPSSSHRKP